MATRNRAARSARDVERPPFSHPELGGGLVDNAKIAAMVWRREFIRFSRNRLRVATSIAQPLLFLFVLGTGLAPAFSATSGSVDFRTFIFPGVLAMTVLFPAVFAAITIVWERQEGFLREMLVAPARRGTVIAGKCAGGASIAAVQGFAILLLAPLVRIGYGSALLVVAAEMVLAALVVSALGLLVASRLDDIESFQVLIQLVVLPIFFLSGAMFPLRRLPSWMATLTLINPLTYVVDPMRRAVFSSIHAPRSSVAALNPGVTWGDWRLPTLFELGLVAAVGVITLGAAIHQFAKAD